MDKDTFETKQRELELKLLRLQVESQELHNEEQRIFNARMRGDLTDSEPDHSDLPSAPNLDDLKEEVDSDGK